MWLLKTFKHVKTAYSFVFALPPCIHWPCLKNHLQEIALKLFFKPKHERIICSNVRSNLPK